MIFCKKHTTVLCNKPTTIAMSSIRKWLAHTTDLITLRQRWSRSRRPESTPEESTIFAEAGAGSVVGFW